MKKKSSYVLIVVAMFQPIIWWGVDVWLQGVAKRAGCLRGLDLACGFSALVCFFSCIIVASHQEEHK